MKETKETVNFSVRLPKEVHKALRRWAKDEDRSLGYMNILCLRQCLIAGGYLPQEDKSSE